MPLLSYCPTHPFQADLSYAELTNQKAHEAAVIVAAQLRQLGMEEKARKVERCGLTYHARCSSNRTLCPVCLSAGEWNKRKKLHSLEQDIYGRFERCRKRYTTVTLIDTPSVPSEMADISQRLHQAFNQMYLPTGTSNPFYAAYGSIEFDPAKEDGNLNGYFNIHLHALSWEPLKRSLDKRDFDCFVEKQVRKAGLTFRSMKSQPVERGEKIDYVTKAVPLVKLVKADLFSPYVTYANQNKQRKLADTIKSAEYRKALKTPASAH